MEERNVDKDLYATPSPRPNRLQEAALAPMTSRTVKSTYVMLYPASDLASLYCEDRDVPVSQFELKMFEDVLFAHARFLRFALSFFRPDFFASDREFIRQVGQVQSRGEYIEAENAFRRRITHFSGFRRMFRLRISTRMMRRIVEGVF